MMMYYVCLCTPFSCLFVLSQTARRCCPAWSGMNSGSLRPNQTRSHNWYIAGDKNLVYRSMSARQKAEAGYLRDAEVAVSAFNALNDTHKEHPLGDTIGSRVMGWLTVRF